MSDVLLRVLSLGAGVQSSAIYLMAVRGEFGPDGPTVAVFADTQWEPKGTYAWLAELERIGGAVIPIRRVTAGSLRADIVDGANRGSRIANIPFFGLGEGGEQVMLRRTCTLEYKIRPLSRESRKMYDEVRTERGITGRLAPGSLEQWIGISTDEATRMKDSEIKYVTHRYPLIERSMSRTDCLAWLNINGYGQPPKSACIGCPYHDDAFWSDMKANRPEEWEDACEFDEFIRTGLRGPNSKGVMRGMRLGGEGFLHSSRLPLRTAPLTPEDRREAKIDANDGRRGLLQVINHWENECEGMCGV